MSFLGKLWRGFWAYMSSTAIMFGAALVFVSFVAKGQIEDTGLMTGFGLGVMAVGLLVNFLFSLSIEKQYRGSYRWHFFLWGMWILFIFFAIICLITIPLVRWMVKPAAKYRDFIVRDEYGLVSKVRLNEDTMRDVLGNKYEKVD